MGAPEADELRVTEGDEDRIDVAHAEVDRGREPDRAARHHRRARRLLLGFVEVGEELHRALVERAPAFGKAYAPGRTVEKPGLQVRFKVGDMTRSRRGGEAQALGCLGKASRFNDLGKYADCP